MRVSPFQSTLLLVFKAEPEIMFFHRLHAGVWLSNLKNSTSPLDGFLCTNVAEVVCVPLFSFGAKCVNQNIMFNKSEN